MKSTAFNFDKVTLKSSKWGLLLEDIGNTISPDSLYRDLVTLLGWSLSRLASDELITVFILF